jgi:hypothetical protein
MPSHKEFYDALNNISVNADTLNLNTDQVESKLDTTTGLLTTLSADTAIIKTEVNRQGTLTNRSTTITAGGTSQQVAAANTSRNYLLIQNISDTAMYVGIGYTPTTTTGLLLSASGGGIVFETSFIPTQAINVLCATTGKAFVAWEG